MKNLFFIFLASALVLMSCGSSESSEMKPSQRNAQGDTEQKSEEKATAPNDGKGIGEVKHVDLNDPLNAGMVDEGKRIYELKCAACHKLNDQRVVGPGWAKVTERRKPEWIMNMTLNVDVMLEEDPAAREMLKECLVRMPNQNLSFEDARAVLEFMYANDGYAVGN